MFVIGFISAKTIRLKQNINGTDFCLCVERKDQEARMLPCDYAKTMKWRVDTEGRLKSKQIKISLASKY